MFSIQSEGLRVVFLSSSITSGTPWQRLHISFVVSSSVVIRCIFPGGPLVVGKSGFLPLSTVTSPSFDRSFSFPPSFDRNPCLGGRFSGDLAGWLLEALSTVSAWCHLAGQNEVQSCYRALSPILLLVVLSFTLLVDNPGRGQHAGLTVSP